MAGGSGGSRAAPRTGWPLNEAGTLLAVFHATSLGAALAAGHLPTPRTGGRASRLAVYGLTGVTNSPSSRTRTATFDGVAT